MFALRGSTFQPRGRIAMVDRRWTPGFETALSHSSLALLQPKTLSGMPGAFP